jgi:hypothetical protein
LVRFIKISNKVAKKFIRTNVNFKNASLSKAIGSRVIDFLQVEISTRKVAQTGQGG